MTHTITIPENIQMLMLRLMDYGHEAYVVGGAVRDQLLGIEPNDWDIFTNCPGDKLKEIFPRGIIMGNEERQQKILTIIVNGVEVSQYRKSGDRTETGGTIVQHCHTCDFTVNALAADVSGQLHDYVGGLTDLKQKIIRFVGDPLDRILEDPIRILRGFRFVSKTSSWVFETVTYNACYIYAESTLKNIPVERVMKEFMKAIECGYPSQFLFYMYEAGLFKYYFPEYAEIRDIKQNPKHHPEGGLYSHIIGNIDKCNPKYRLEYFLHDYGKNKSKVQDGENRWYTFKEHDDIGAKLIMEDLMPRLKLSYEIAESCATAAKYHMQAHFIMPNPTKRTIRRFQSRFNSKHLKMLAEVCRVDAGIRRDYDAKIFEQSAEEAQALKPVVNGKFLMGKGHKQGRDLGIIKQRCYNIQIEHDITDPEKIYEILCFWS